MQNSGCFDTFRVLFNCHKQKDQAVFECFWEHTQTAEISYDSMCVGVKAGGHNQRTSESSLQITGFSGFRGGQRGMWPPIGWQFVPGKPVHTHTCTRTRAHTQTHTHTHSRKTRSHLVALINLRLLRHASSIWGTLGKKQTQTLVWFTWHL